MKAADVMVTNVIAVGADATVQQVAEILLANRISAVPVVGNDGELVGIISEGDLLRRSEIDTERRRSGWLALFLGNSGMAADFVKMHGRKVADLMTHEVVTACPDTPLRDVATLLEKNRIKRVPIVEAGKLVGIVSRANLVQALATARKPVKAGTATSDLLIREDIIARLSAESWTKAGRTNVIVHDGAVELWGTVRSEAEKQAVRAAVELTPGVRVVHNNLVVETLTSSLHLVAA